MKRSNALFVLAIFFLFSASVWADVPSLIGLQGALKNNSGGPVVGTNSVLFKIYTSPAGSTFLWMETQSVTTDSQGVFSILLGSVTPIPDSVFRDTLAFLGIKVGSDPEMTPRQRLVSVGYSFGIPALRIDGDKIILDNRLGGSVGIVDATTIGENFSDSSITAVNGLAIEGDVGIGTPNPTSPAGFNKKLTLQSSGFGPSVGLRNTNVGGEFFEVGSTVDLGGVNPRLDFFCTSSPTPIATLTSTCKVGIGTKTPSQKFEVVGNAKVSDTVFAGVISTTGNVGIGINNAQERLDVRGGNIQIVTANPKIILADNLGSGFIGTDNNKNFIFAPDGSERLRIKTNGNVGIGMTNPLVKLGVQDNSLSSAVSIVQSNSGGFGMHIKPGSDGNYALLINNAADNINRHIFYGSGDAHLALPGGRVGIGTESPAASLGVNGDACNNTGVWAVCSDRRLKTDIEPIYRALETVEKLQGVTFHWKDAKKDAEFGRVRGLIAQDVEKVIPEWIKTDPDGYKRIEPIGVDALLIEAIKELKSENEELKKRILKLEKSSPQARVGE